MKLQVITLALLCLTLRSFAQRTGDASASGGTVEKCYNNASFVSTDKGSSAICASDQNKFCVKYRDLTNGKFTWRCSKEDCKTITSGGTADACYDCHSNDCNNEVFSKAQCWAYSGSALGDNGTSIPCDYGMTCLMYKETDANQKVAYIRACSNATHANCLSLPNKDCLECKGDNCNDKEFKFKCFSYDGLSPNALSSDPAQLFKECPSSKCISYKDTKTGNFKRGCAEDTTTCSQMTPGNLCTECSADICNKGPIVVTTPSEPITKDGSTVEASDVTNAPSTLKTDGSTVEASDVTNAPSTLKTDGSTVEASDVTNAPSTLKTDGSTVEASDVTTKPSTPKTDDGSTGPLKSSGSTFSLDARVAAIAVAGSLMIFRSF